MAFIRSHVVCLIRSLYVSVSLKAAKVNFSFYLRESWFVVHLRCCWWNSFSCYRSLFIDKLILQSSTNRILMSFFLSAVLSFFLFSFYFNDYFSRAIFYLQKLILKCCISFDFGYVDLFVIIPRDFQIEFMVIIF